MVRVITARVFLGAILLVAWAGLATADDVGKAIRGKVQLGVHEFSVVPDSAYIAVVTAKPSAVSASVTEAVSSPVFDFSGGNTQKVELLFSPITARKIKVNITPSVVPQGEADYTLLVERHKLEAKPLVDVKGTFTPKDKTERRGIVKDYPVKLRKGRLYVAELVLKSKSDRVCPGFGLKGSTDPGDFSSYSSFGGPDETANRVTFRPRTDGEYNASAGLFSELPDGPCPFTFKVYQEATKGE